MCAGQMAGVEAAIHSVRELFVYDDCDVVLFVDASNAFNSLNRIVALHKIRQLCPPICSFPYDRQNCLSHYSPHNLTHTPIDLTPGFLSSAISWHATKGERISGET